MFYTLHAMTFWAPLSESCKLGCYYSWSVKTGLPFSDNWSSGVKVHIEQQAELFICRGMTHFLLLKLCTLHLLKFKDSDHKSSLVIQTGCFFPPQIWHSEGLSTFPWLFFPAVLRCCWFILSPAEKITTGWCLYFKIRALPLRNIVCESWLSQSLWRISLAAAAADAATNAKWKLALWEKTEYVVASCTATKLCKY